MGLHGSADAYKDCEDHFATALNSERGIGLRLSAPGLVTQLAQKLNTYRERLRKDSRKVYPSDDPRHGVSIYDKLQVAKDPDDPCRLLIRPYSIQVQAVEKL